MIKNYLTKVFFFKMLDLVVEDVLLPLAKEYVKKTSNNYDDMAVMFLEDFVKDVIKEETEKEEK